MRGRKPTPTALKVLHGNPGRRPLNAREPKPKVGLPPCPSSLKGTARLAWRQMAKMLRDAGIGTVLDRNAMILLVDAWETYVSATTTLRQSGLLVKSPTGYPMQNPLLAVANRAHEQIVRLLAEFGMTPASRTRVHVELPQAPDPLQEFLSRQ